MATAVDLQKLMVRSWSGGCISRKPVIRQRCGRSDFPVILDRCHQARVRDALEPEWEARFEPRSYGFRPGRGCHDAIGSLFNTLRGKCKRVWILDADLAGAFDKIDHEHLLKAIGGFPARGMIAGWLRAGIFEAGKGYSPTEEGTPQGGVITPPTQVRT